MDRPLKLFLFLSLSLLLTGCFEQEAKVVIAAPIEKVWAYTKDSSQAKDWSVFFDHISPFGDRPDGSVGSQRRCFRRANDQGLTWDEEVLAIEEPHYRSLRTYNIINSPIPHMENFECMVEHRLKKLDEQHTELIFSSKPSRTDFRFSNVIQALRGGMQAARIVQLNVENIKKIIETGSTADLHPYMEEANPFFDKPD